MGFIVDFPKFKTYVDQPVKYIQPKLDGHLVKIHKAKTLTVLTKNDKDITEKVLAMHTLNEEMAKIPSHTIMFGEMHCPGVHATSVPTLLNDRSEKLQITFFAAPLFGTRNLFNAPLNDVMDRLNDCGLKTPHTSIVSLTPTPFISLCKEYQEKLLAEAIEKGYEGWVCKEAHMKGWYKLKPVKTVDAFVVGTARSWSSTHFGGLQSITVAVFKRNKVHILADVGSGFELEYRKTIDRYSLVGKVAEIAYDQVAANGRLRFPRFIRWRDDKYKQQCTFDQLQ